MSSLWFNEPNEEQAQAQQPFDPWKKREDKHKQDQIQRKLENSLSTSSNHPRSRTNSKSDNEDDWSQFSSMCGPPKVTRNMSVIPMNHPAQFLYPDSDDEPDRKGKRNRSRSRSNSRSRHNSRPSSRLSQNDSKREELPSQDEISKIERKKSKKRKAIVKGRSVAEFDDKNVTFLDVRLMSNEKQRTLSKRRKTRSARAGGYAAMAANSATSGSFSERREAKRLESVDLQDDEDESEATERSTSMENIKWDKASDKIVAEEIGVTISTFKRMKSATGYTNTQLVEGREQFKQSFPDGVVTKKEFKLLAKDIGVSKWEAVRFTENVFKMFDINGDQALTFEEFMFATSAQNFDNSAEKLGWLFDNVYDRDHDGRINRMEVKDILKNLLIMEGFDNDKAYWMVEDVFQKVHEDQMEKLAEKKIPSSEPREIDGKMDKKKFLEYVQGSKFISGLLAVKSDTARKEKIDKDLKKVDVQNLEIRSRKPVKNSQREVELTKTRRSVRRSTRRKPYQKQSNSNRSHSASRMETDDEVFSTRSARV